jgi:hypothetical protein
MRILSAAALVCCASVSAQQAARPAAETQGGTPWAFQGAATNWGDGWFMLTPAQHDSVGTVRYTGAPFALGDGVLLSFSYAVWGGGEPGGDGLSVFLYDAQKDMGGAKPGGGLGYCQGDGGWLAFALDEFGNFSNAADVCGSGSGAQPQSVVLRGPASAKNPLIARAALPARIDRPAATARPAPAQVLMHLRREAGTSGYRIDVDWRESADAGWRRVINNASFPFAAPGALRLGIAASTGGARNVHEIGNFALRHLAATRVEHGFEPASVRIGENTTLVLKLSAPPGQKATLLQPFGYQLPPGVKVADPIELGGTCPGSVRAKAGDGSIRVDAGTVALGSGCTLTVRLKAQAVGEWQVKIPAGTWAFYGAPNAPESSAALAVKP